MQKLYLFSRPKGKLLRNRNFWADLLIWRSDFELLQFHFLNKNSVHSFFKRWLITLTLDFFCLQWDSFANKDKRKNIYHGVFLRSCCWRCRLSNTRAPGSCAHQNVRILKINLGFNFGELRMRAQKIHTILPGLCERSSI